MLNEVEFIVRMFKYFSMLFQLKMVCGT